MQHQQAPAAARAAWQQQQQQGPSGAAAQPHSAAAGAVAAVGAGAGAHAQAAGSAPSSSAEVGWGLERSYDLLGKIGEGTYGVVFLATAKHDKQRLYAIKKFKTGREGDGISPTAIREILLLRELHHEHIVRLTAVHVNRSEPSLSLAFDYAEHDMYEIIWHHRDRLAGPIDPYVVKSLMWQLLNGLSHLHQNWIIHRDLKPSNVLVMGEGPEAGVVKVADFGLARFFQAPLRPLADNGVVVTIWYRPPELLLGGRHYTRAVDMWGAGCIFAELLTLRPLFQGQERKQAGAAFQLDQLDKIFRVLGHPNPKTWPHLELLHHWATNTENVRVKRTEWGDNRLQSHLAGIMRHLGEAFARAGARGAQPAPAAVAAATPKLSPAGLELLQAMLEYDPLKRISAEDALHHPYFKEAPLPGPNAFVCQGRRVASYPRRHKQTVFSATGTAPAAAGGGGGATATGAATAQQQQAAGQQLAAAGDAVDAAGAAATSGQQHYQHAAGYHAQQQQQRQPPPPRQQQQQFQRTGSTTSHRSSDSQSQQPPALQGRKRKADGQQGRKGDGQRGSSGSRGDRR